MFQQAQPVIQDVINRTAEINSAIGARAHATLQSSQEISHALLEQLKVLVDHGAQIPASMLDVRFRWIATMRTQGMTSATLQAASKATNDVKGIILEKDASLQDKSNKLGAYVIVCLTFLQSFRCIDEAFIGSSQASRRRDLQLRARCKGNCTRFEVAFWLTLTQNKAKAEGNKAADRANEAVNN